MTDEELIERLREWWEYDLGNIIIKAADRIEELVKERDNALELIRFSNESDFADTLLALDKHEIAYDKLSRLQKAVKPFYAAVFNDNGDVTISTGHITNRDWINLSTAMIGSEYDSNPTD